MVVSEEPPPPAKSTDYKVVNIRNFKKKKYILYLKTNLLLVFKF